LALSFVRNTKDIAAVRRILSRLGAKIPVIAKIEKPAAVACYESILRAADGIMVARGDLGIEMGVHRVPVIQKQLVREANQAGVPVIIATQMLESMIDFPRPTRAEASDVANAVFDGADAVMLSGETAIGRYPFTAVGTMDAILNAAEKSTRPGPERLTRRSQGYGDTAIHTVVHGARFAASQLGAKAVVVFSRSGTSALMLSKLKPSMPVVAFVGTPEVARRLNLCWGVIPLVLDYSASWERLLKRADAVILKKDLLNKGDAVVIVSGSHDLPGMQYVTKIHRVGETG